MRYLSVRKSLFSAGAVLLLGAVAMVIPFLPEGAMHAAGVSKGIVPLFFLATPNPTSAGSQFWLRGPGFRACFETGLVRFQAGGRSWEVRLEGANLASRLEPLDGGEGKVNFLLGPDSQQWRTGLAAYDSLINRDIYPGVDLLYRLEAGHVKSEFRLRPGADPHRIRWRYEGGWVRIGRDGALTLDTGAGRMREPAPRIYQIRGSSEVEVRGGYRDLGGNRFGFWVDSYDRGLDLVIDPVISYSTYLGGTGMDVVRAVAIDGSGNTYVAGYTESANFPVLNPAQVAKGGGVEAFVAKLSPAGALLYCTYLGGSGDDRAFGIAVDSSASAYVTGWTYSANFPVSASARQRTLGGGRDAFAVKLSPAGNSLVYSSYLGGAGHDSGNAIAVDAAGQAVLAGDTYSSNFPVAGAFQGSNGGGQDGFVSKLSADGSALLWSTYLGGAADDRANGVAMDPTGAVYVTGGTFSTNFPAVQALRPANAGGQDAFVSKLTADGRSLVYSTYLGGSGGTISANETGTAIRVDGGGNATVAGMTPSLNFPVVNAFQSTPGGGMDAFVTRLNAAGTGLIYSTYLGGASLDYALALEIAPNGIAAVAGYTASGDFPLAQPLQGSRAGGYDAFVARLNPQGSALEFSTYWGGSDNEAAYAVAMDRAGNLWLAGQTLSLNYPLWNAVQNADSGGGSSFLVKIIDRTPAAAFRDTNGSPRLTIYGSSLLPNGGGYLTSEVGVWQNSNGEIFVVGGNTSSCVYMNTYRLATHTWTGWLRAGCGMTGNPVVTASNTGEAWVFARDAAYNYYLSRFVPGAGFTAWSNLGGGFTSDPAAAVSKDGSVYVAGRKGDGRVYAGRWASGGFQGWVAASSGPTIDGKPALVCGSDGAAYIAVRAADRSTWIARFQGASWGTWYSAGGVAYGGPEAAATGGVVYVAVTNVNGLVYIRPFVEGTGNGWQSWINSGGNLRRASIAGVNGRFYIAGRALDNNLWWYESGAGWTPMGNGDIAASELIAGPR